MLINQKIIEALKPLNIPVAFCEYKGDASKYCVFMTTYDGEALYYDDVANSQLLRVSLNYYYNNPKDMQLIEDIKRLLKSSNFVIISSQDIHANGSGFFNRAFYIKYTNQY